MEQTVILMLLTSAKETTRPDLMVLNPSIPDLKFLKDGSTSAVEAHKS